MVADPPADLTLTPLTGEPRTVSEWLTNFHLLLAVIDPYTNESAWILKTAARVLDNFQQADVRVAWLVAGDADDARSFLGPYADEFLTFADADRSVVKALGLARTPALVHVGTNLKVVGAAEGWNPIEWRAVSDKLATVMSWAKPLVPDRGDPAPFEGASA